MSGFNQRSGAGGSSTGGDTKWMKLQIGANKLRIVSEYHQFFKHFGDGPPYVCLGKEVCTRCKAAKGMPDGEEKKKYLPSPRYLMWVMDFEDGCTMKLMEVGYSVVGEFEDMCEGGEWPFSDGGVPKFNCTISKTSTGPLSQNVEYGVQGSPNGVGEPLPPAQLEEVAKLTSAKEIHEKIVNKQTGTDTQGQSNSAGSSDEAPPPTSEPGEEIRVEDIPF